MLCIQFLLEFSNNRFESLHRCYNYTENMYVSLCNENKRYFMTKLQNFFLLFHFWDKALIWRATLCNQLLLQFSGVQFESFHRCY